jgi:hypothetical protein
MTRQRTIATRTILLGRRWGAAAAVALGVTLIPAQAAHATATATATPTATATTGAGAGTSTANTTPGNVGGLDLASYCQSLGDHGTTSAGPAILRRAAVTGPNFAYQNWACVQDNGKVVPMSDTGPAPSLLDACLHQYPNVALYAAPLDANDAFSWNCFLLPPAASSSVADEDKSAVTALMQTDTVQAEIATLQAEVATGHAAHALVDGVRFLQSRPVQELIADVLGGYHLTGQQPVVTAELGVAMVKAVLRQP